MTDTCRDDGADIPEIAAVTGRTFKQCEDILFRYGRLTKRMARRAFDAHINLTET